MNCLIQLWELESWKSVWQAIGLEIQAKVYVAALGLNSTGKRAGYSG